MQEVHLERDLPVPAEDVWALLSDFGSIIKWLPSGNDNSTVVLTGEGVGMFRDLDMPSVGKVQHRLDRLDPDNMLITYSLTKGQPLGMVDYQMSVSVSPAGDGACRIKFYGEFEGDPTADIAQMAKNLEDSYRGMCDGLVAYIGAN